MEQENLTQGRLGAHNELIAATWLLRQGYEVFRNVAPVGPVDIVGIKDGKIELFDVKTAYRSGDRIIRAKFSPEQKALGVKCIGVLADGGCVINTEELTGGSCEECGKVFVQGKRWEKRRFCSTVCGGRSAKRRKRIGADGGEPML